MPLSTQQMPQIATQHATSYNPNPNMVTWERLEKLRMKKLNLKNTQHSDISRLHRYPLSFGFVSSGGMNTVTGDAIHFMVPTKPELYRSHTQPALGKAEQHYGRSNCLAPFVTSNKPTCGYYFNRDTNNKKQKSGIPPSDLVKWRN